MSPVESLLETLLHSNTSWQKMRYNHCRVSAFFFTPPLLLVTLFLYSGPFIGFFIQFFIQLHIVKLIVDLGLTRYSSDSMPTMFESPMVSFPHRSLLLTTEIRRSPLFEHFDLNSSCNLSYWEISKSNSFPPTDYLMQ